MVKRRGRERKPDYVTSWGEKIEGAYLSTDKRLRPIGKATPAFGGEERIAVAKFRRWQAEQSDRLPKVIPDDATDVERAKMISQGRVKDIIESERLDDIDGIRSLLEAEKERLRNLILSDPQQAAIELRIPDLAERQPKREKPDKTLAELGALYIANKRNKQGKPLGAKYRKNSAKWWEDFLKSCGVTYARDITDDMIQRYNDEVMAEFDAGKSPAYVRNRFACVCAILNYGIQRTKDKKELRRVLDECAIFTPPAEINDPKPIKAEHFRALLDIAKPRERCCLLLGLNCLMHGGEVVSTEKKSIDLEARTLSARRSKTQHPRVAHLWQRTCDEISAYLADNPNRSKYLFVSRTGAALTSEMLRQRIVTLRKNANLPDYVTFEGLRDAGYTIGEEVDAHHVKYVAGHSTGMNDKYVLRQATNKKVVAVCEAIEAHFFGAEEKETADETEKPKPKRKKKTASKKTPKGKK